MPPPPWYSTATAAEPWSTTPVRARSPLLLLAVPCTSLSPVQPLPRDWTTNMVRTRGGHRYRPRVMFSTPEMEDAGTSKAVDAHSLDLSVDTQPALAPAAIPKEPQASEPPFRRYQTRVGLRPLLWCLRDDTRGPDPPSGPGHQARRSLRDLGLSLHLRRLMRVHCLCYHRPRGSGALYSSAIRFRGTWICVQGTFMGSHITTYQH